MILVESLFFGIAHFSHHEKSIHVSSMCDDLNKQGWVPCFDGN